MHNRQSLLAALTETEFDLLIIGGGATGAGIALDAASRGLKTALVEKQDYAAGTSSRSTKLIHGGLRYLKQLEFALVAEVGQERAIVHQLAPHLVEPEKMMLPFVKGGSFNKLTTSIALKVYDWLAGVKGDDRRVMLSRAKALKMEPSLNEDLLLGAGLYAEYRTDDARLTVELIKAAVAHGAVCLNYCRVNGLTYQDHTVNGAKMEDLLGPSSFEVRAKKVVNAAGPWVDEMRKMDGSLSGKRLHLTKGVHIVVARDRLPLNHAQYFDMPDGRMIFAIPRHRTTYIGTTDTDYSGPKENPRTTAQDVSYLLEGANRLFPRAGLKPEHIESSWAGLRPLIHEDGKSASELSRKDEIFISPSGLISIAGGKLTGYRKMAKKVTTLVAKALGKKDARSLTCVTRNIGLGGGGFVNAAAVKTYVKEIQAKVEAKGLPAWRAAYLVHNYGLQTDEILAKMESGADPERALILAETDFAFQREFATGPADVLIRRTGRLYFDHASAQKYLPEVTDYFTRMLQLSPGKASALAHEAEVALREASEFPSA